MVFDARDAAARIPVPVLMVCGDKDEIFPREAVEETAALIPDCTVNLVKGKNHMQLAMSDRIPKAVLKWLHAASA